MSYNNIGMSAESVKIEIFIRPFIEKILLIHGPKYKGKGAKVEKLPVTSFCHNQRLL